MAQHSIYWASWLLLGGIAIVHALARFWLPLSGESSPSLGALLAAEASLTLVLVGLAGSPHAWRLAAPACGLLIGAVLAGESLFSAQPTYAWMLAVQAPAMLAVLLYWRFCGYRLRVDPLASSPDRSHISLAEIMLWTAAAALLLTGVQAIQRWFPTLREAPSWIVYGSLGIGYAGSALSGVRLLWRVRPWWWGHLCYLLLAAAWGALPAYVWRDPTLIAPCLRDQAGFAAFLAVSILLFRQAGLVLTHPTDGDALSSRQDSRRPLVGEAA